MQEAPSTASGTVRCELHPWQNGNLHMRAQPASNCNTPSALHSVL